MHPSRYPQSWIYQEILDDIIATCKAQAAELQLGDENCSDEATIASSGTCPGEHTWCAAASNDEVGTPDLPPA